MRDVIWLFVLFCATAFTDCSYHLSYVYIYSNCIETFYSFKLSTNTNYHHCVSYKYLAIIQILIMIAEELFSRYRSTKWWLFSLTVQYRCESFVSIKWRHVTTQWKDKSKDEIVMQLLLYNKLILFDFSVLGESIFWT